MKEEQKNKSSEPSLNEEMRVKYMYNKAKYISDVFKYARKTGHTTGMFRAWLRHIQHHADRVVIVATDFRHAEVLRDVERRIANQLREEFKEKNKPSKVRQFFINLGLATNEKYYVELGEIVIVPFENLSRYMRGNKAIIVMDNYVMADLIE